METLDSIVKKLSLTFSCTLDASGNLVYGTSINLPPHFFKILITLVRAFF